MIEAAAIIEFNSRSLSSNGNYLFQNFENLSGDKKVLCAYSLCGILDFTNDLPIGQRSLFTPSQWSYLKNEFKSGKVKHLPKLSKSMEKIISEVKKVLYIYIYVFLYMINYLFIFIYLYLYSLLLLVPQRRPITLLYLT